MFMSNLKTNKFFVIIGSSIVGILSGLAVNFAVTYHTVLMFDTYSITAMFAGIFFGIVTLPWLLYLFYEQFSVLKIFIVSILWVFSSFLSYYLAALTDIEIRGLENPYGYGTFLSTFENVGLATAGFFGALIVALAFHFLFVKMKIRIFALVCLAGAGFAFFMYIESPFFGVALYPAWQGAVMSALGFASVYHPSSKS